MRKRKSTSPDKHQEALLDEVKQLKHQVHQLQLECDILTKENELIKKDMGVSVVTPNRWDKTQLSAYCIAISQAPENLLAKNFCSCRPNEKWLTDINEVQFPISKVHLSPVIDCFDGKVVSWTIATRPDAKWVNARPDNVTVTLRKLMLHELCSVHISHISLPLTFKE